MTANEIVAFNIKKNREEADIKQTAFAKALGINVGRLSAIENGKADISISLVEKIAKILNKNFYEILSVPQTVNSGNISNSPDSINFNLSNNNSVIKNDIAEKAIDLLEKILKEIKKT